MRLTCTTGILCMVAVTAMTTGAMAGPIIDLNAKTATTTNPVVLTLDAGCYRVTPIGIADGGQYDAWNAWGRVSLPAQGWVNKYNISSSEAGDLTSWDGIKYGTALEALQQAAEETFTLTYTQDVKLYIADDPYYDNIGGMSLRLSSCTPSIPAPAAVVLAALGSGFVGWLRRRDTL